MFLIGFDMYGNQAFDANFSSYDYTYLKLTNLILDECSVDAGNKEFNTNKTEWQSNTVFLATFNNTLEAGNLSMGDMEVDTLRFKKRKKGDVNWLLIEEVPYDKNQEFYEIKDRLARSNIEYEYAIVPVSGNVEGNSISNSLMAIHEGLWIVDANNSVNIFCEVDYGTINHNTNVVSFDLLNNRYPVVISGELDYVSGTISGRLVSNESLLNNELNIQAEVNLRENVFAFMKNGKPKIMKNNEGRYYLIVVTDVVEKPHPLNDASVTLSFNYVEVGDAEDLQTLIDSNLLPEQLGEG